MQVVDRHRDGAGNMAGRVFAGGAGIDDDHALRTCQLQQLVHRYRLGIAAIAEVLQHDPLEIRQASLGNRANDLGQLEDIGVGQPVADEQAVLPAVDERRVFERLQVLRRVGERQLHFRGQRLHRTFPLRQQLQDFEAVRIGEGLAEAGELPVEAVLELAMCAGMTR